VRKRIAEREPSVSLVFCIRIKEQNSKDTPAPLFASLCYFIGILLLTFVLRFGKAEEYQRNKNERTINSKK